MAKTITPALSDHRSASRAAAASQANSWRKRQRLWWMLFIVPAVVVYVIFMAMPLINSMGLSFYTGEGLRPERFVGLDNYIQLFTGTVLRERFFNALRNTFVFFSIHMIVQNSLGLFFALLLNSQIRGRNIYRTIIFAPATMSVLVTGFLWSLILNPQWGAAKKILEAFGMQSAVHPWLGDTQTALMTISLVSSWQWVGLPTMMFLAGLLTIPQELIEAAHIDGASTWEVFIRVKLPLLIPVIGIVSVLTFVGNFNAFDVVYTMAGARGQPDYSTDLLATFFYRTAIAGEHPVAKPDMGLGAAIATITFLILLSGVSLWLILSRRAEQNAFQD
ncbi:MAG TPA: sugar ABC transporter permease [Aggregatilineales bacterium]|nr:sugar ABC transporter permease [Anaerolineales bacterium]HRE49369.1 sugar ABC transporter permease [Aggregatilineales bacterium]